MEIVNNPHDKLIRELLRDKENAKDFLNNFLPKHILKLVNLDQLEIAKDSFVDDSLKEYFSDILYKITFSGHIGYLYFLFEHKSYNDKFTSFQMLKYMVQIWDLEIKQNKKELFPVVLPFVVYHGKEVWSAGTRFSELFGSKPKELAPYIPDYEFILTDLSKYSDNDLKCIADLKIGLLLLKYALRGEYTEKLESIFPLFKELQNKEGGLEYLYTVIRYIMTTAEGISTVKLKTLIESNISKDIGDDIMTIADQLRQEGEQKGIQKGIQEGRQEGKLEEAKGSVLTVIETRFNFVPKNIRNQITAIENIETLEKLHKESITVVDLNTFSRILAEIDVNKH